MRKFICWVLCVGAWASAMAESVITSADDLLKKFPGGIQLNVGAANVPAVLLANQILAKEAFGRQVAMSLKFSTVDHQEQGLYGHAIAASAERSKSGAVAVVCTVYFAPDQLERLATLDLADAKLGFHGVIAKAEIVRGDELTLYLDIVAARVGEKGRKAMRSSRPARVKVISAVYGGSKHQADVTERVRKFVEKDKAAFWVSPGDLGADPTPGWNKTLTVVYTKDGVRRLQARTETERVLFESFSMPQDAKELEAWLIGSRWKAGREFLFLPEGLFITSGQVARWHALSDSRIEIIWTPEVTLECQFDYVWGSFTEEGGLKTLFTRVAGK